MVRDDLDSIIDRKAAELPYLLWLARVNYYFLDFCGGSTIDIA